MQQDLHEFLKYLNFSNRNFTFYPITIGSCPLKDFLSFFPFFFSSNGV
jgi:hypothetical protein